jgi:hypothetical protein
MARTALALSAGFAHRQGMEFRFTEIPSDYPFEGPLDFNAKHMQALFDFGAACASSGRLWLSTPQAIAQAEIAQPPSGALKCPLETPSPGKPGS